MADAKYLICALIQHQGSGRCPQKNIFLHIFLHIEEPLGKPLIPPSPSWVVIGAQWASLEKATDF